MPIPCCSAATLRCARIWTALFALALVALLPAAAVRAITTGEYCADGEEQAFLGLINSYRAGNGLGPLAMTQTLGTAAEHHSLDMAANNYFSHTMLDGTDVRQNLINHGYPNGTYGENIAAGMETAAVAFTTWQNSPGHNANMLRSNYAAIGIGRAYDANSEYGWYWTTVFGGAIDGDVTLCGGVPAPAPSPAPAPDPNPAPTTGANATVASLLNLRAGPGTGFGILTTMPAGTRVAVTGPAQDGFYPVTVGTQSGWAASDFLALDGTPPAPAPDPTPPPPSAPVPGSGTATATTDLNLRAGPSTADAVLLTIPAGSAVTLTGQSTNGFVGVSFNGISGWAFAAYLGTSTAPPPAPPAPGPAPHPGGTGTATVVSDLNLRTGPGAAFPVLLVMPPGAVVTLTGGAEPGFLAVRFNGVDGWASTDFLATGGAAPGPGGIIPDVDVSNNPSPGAGTATTTSEVNLRSGPSTADGVLSTLPAGAVVMLNGVAMNGFVSVTYNGAEGWVFADYLA